MKKTYEVAKETDRRALAEFVKREGQFLLPMVELVERTELVIDEVVQVATPTVATSDARARFLVALHQCSVAHHIGDHHGEKTTLL